MSSRYQTQLIITQRADGKSVYKPVRPTKIKESITDVKINSGEQTRLDLLSFKTYGLVSQWWRIASRNGRVDGSLYFSPGEEIFIPMN